MALFSTIWRYLKRPLYKIFFTAPITFGRRRGVEIDAVLLTYGYLIFVLLVGIGYLLPLICYFAWGFASRLCLYTPMRGYVQDICIGPHLTQTPIEDPWFIGFWQNEDDLPEERPESWIDHIMTAPALLQDANLFLDKAIRKTKQLPPGGLLAKDIVGDIGKPTPLQPVTVSARKRLTLIKSEPKSPYRSSNQLLRPLPVLCAKVWTIIIPIFGRS